MRRSVVACDTKKCRECHQPNTSPLNLRAQTVKDSAREGWLTKRTHVVRGDDGNTSTVHDFDAFTDGGTGYPCYPIERSADIDVNVLTIETGGRHVCLAATPLGWDEYAASV
eukprot:CAMPEP_0178474122 /NCGR_PEP_ID=MMETSP0696-20121128/2440_1 /TAXON_ID=265572 /ORGANISM="Extubocellulus spinifer, Strain CCMP396" /LENGTH=111 /DNA_ID=CAMNT_0020101367 /DNA_START=59 /DNA_END=390 /DNA_ORIENTATION=+